jgi:hypothetical protein
MKHSYPPRTQYDRLGPLDVAYLVLVLSAVLACLLYEAGITKLTHEPVSEPVTQPGSTQE